MWGSLKLDNDLRRNVFDWDDLQIFHAVATTGSMSAAATVLGCQQSTVSKRMRQLESRLSSQLIERRADGVVLTRAGTAALDYAVTMQRSAQRLETEIAGMDRSLAGQVSLRVPDGLATYWLARHIPEFQRVNPEVVLKLINDRSAAASDTAAALSLTFTPDKAMDTEARALGSIHYMPMASREFIATYGAPRSLEDVLTLRFLRLEQYDPSLHLWQRKATATDEVVRYSFTADISSVLFETIRHGGGIAMAPTYLASLFPDELVVLDYDFHQDVRFWLKNSPGSLGISRIKCVADWIAELFNRRLHPWFREEFCHPSEFCDVEVIKPQT